MRRALKAFRQLRGPSDPRHGTTGGYSYWGCRCDRCRTAATARVREHRETAAITTHGRYGYDLGCRCDVCRDGKTSSSRERDRIRREWRASHRTGKATKADMSKLA